MYVVDVDDPNVGSQIKVLSERIENIHLSSGAYGQKARRLVREGKIDVHDPFHALENAFLQASLGKQYVLYTDTSLLPLVGLNLARVENKVGLRINVLFCSHAEIGGAAEGGTRDKAPKTVAIP